MKPITILPQDFQVNWLAHLTSARNEPAYKLVDIQRTKQRGFQELKIIVRVLDLNGFPMPGVDVAFAYSTANNFLVPENSVWAPPYPYKADIFQTQGGGQIEHVQGSTVRKGEPGGVTVYIFDPENAESDVVSGMGALSDHTGVILTFQYQDSSIVDLWTRLDNIEQRLDDLENS